MHKKFAKYIALFLMLLLTLACFAGCKNKKNVYGAASDFIKVSHPDKPNTNVFSDENYTDKESSAATDKGGNSSGTDTSSVSSADSASSKQEVGGVSGADSQKVSGDSKTDDTVSSGSSVQQNGNSNDIPVASDDQGPVVDVP
ncbi:MAG: hypothetical protein J5659_07410 [Clostridia bacterium]|nr:hypothetical protein [Clostridia bacterium]